MLAVLLHLLAVQGILVHDGLSSGVDAGLSSFLWMSCHFLAPFPSCQLRGGPRHQREGGLRAVLGRFLWVLALRGGLLGWRHVTLPNIFYAHKVVPVPVLAPGLHHVGGAPAVLNHVLDLDRVGLGDWVIVIVGYLGIFHLQDSPHVQWCLLPLLGGLS